MRWTDRTRALVELSCPWSDGDARPSAETLLQDSLAEIMEANPDIVSDALFGRAELSWDIQHALSEGVKSLGRLSLSTLASAAPPPSSPGCRTKCRSAILRS